MHTSKFVVLTCCTLASAAVCLAGKSLFFNPMGASAMGPSAPSTMLTVNTDGQQAGIVVAASTAVAAEDFQQVFIPLNGIPSNTKIKGAKICYKVTTSSPGTTYMLARLSEALTNGTGTVIHDDPAVLSNTVFECHTTTVPPPGAKLNGPLVLSLWMVFGSSSDKIHIGRIEVF